MDSNELIHLIGTYGYGVLSVLVGLEGLGLPLPGEAALVGAAIYAGTTHHLTLGYILLASIMGASLGDNIGYAVGRLLGFRLVVRFGTHIGLDDKKLKLGQYLFHRYGAIIVFVGRFVPLLRMFAPLLAGTNRMPWRRFFLANLPGGVLWSCAYGVGAYALGTAILRFKGVAGIIGGVVAVVVVVGVMAWMRRTHQRLIAEAERTFPGPVSDPKPAE